MKSYREYKDTAKKMLAGKYWNFVVACLIYFGISFGVDYVFPEVAIIGILCECVMIYGLINYTLHFIHNENPVYNDLFLAFKDNKLGKVLGTGLLVRLYTFLWSLLLIVPGIIKGLGWSMTTYILRENPDRTTSECMKMSEEMMDGHKWDLFKFRFSFIGWYILAGLCAGLGLPFVLPLIQTANALYYEDLKKEYNRSKIKVETVKEEKKEEPKQEEKKEEPKKIEKKETKKPVAKKTVKKTTTKKTATKEKEEKK